MTVALCTGCGEMKFGAWLACKKCGFTSTGNRGLDVFLPDHYLDAEALGYLQNAVRRMYKEVADAESLSQVSVYFIAKSFPDLMQLKVPHDTRELMEYVINKAAIPPVPLDVEFDFSMPIKNRTGFRKLISFFTRKFRRKRPRL